MEENKAATSPTPQATTTTPDTTTATTSYEDLVKKGALLRRLNQELNRQNKALATDADAVLSSTTGPNATTTRGHTAPRISRPGGAPHVGRLASPKVGGLGNTTPGSRASTASSKPQDHGRGGGAASPSNVTAASASETAVNIDASSGGRAGGGNSPAGSSPVQVDEDGVNVEGMGAEATIRIQRARINVLQKQLKDSLDERATMSKRVTDMESEMKSVMEERRKLSLKIKSLEAAVEKEARGKADKENTSAQRQQQADALEKQVVTLRKANKHLENENKTKEVRLNRALEEVERLKVSLQKERSAKKDDTQQEKKEVDRLTAEVRRLERQKGELLAAFRKQMQLIELLRRQKLHIEAARLLSFTEEEFVKVLDWNV